MTNENKNTQEKDSMNAEIPSSSSEEYNADDIQVLKGLEGVRKRPSMYIGSTHKEGWHHLVWEIVDNSIDEVLAGICTNIKIRVNKNGSITIEDNGRGIPTGMHKEYNKPTLEVIVTHLHAGGKFDKGSYKISGGLHGVGISVVAALSSEMLVEICRDNKYYYQNFAYGKKTTEMKSMSLEEYKNSERFKIISNRVNISYSNGNNHQNNNSASNGGSSSQTNKKTENSKNAKLNNADNEDNADNADNTDNADNVDDQEDYFKFTLGLEHHTHGTRVTFKPDPLIFKAINEVPNPWDYNIINNRLRDLAYLNPSVEIELYDENTNYYDEHQYEGGISQFVEFLNQNKKTVHSNPIYISGTRDNVNVEIALQYNEGFIENILSFVNNVSTHEGGTHLSGFKSALTRTLNNYVGEMKNKKLKNVSFLGSDTREGLTSIISVKVPEPQFEGQTKTKLGNEEVYKIVSSIMGNEFGRYLEEHPGDARKIIAKCALAHKSRIAAKKARESVQRKGALDSGRLPGKLADCSTKDPVRSELFIVEGDSAGGSAKQGRDRETQAILPLRGKILNVEKASQHKIHENKEIKAMISAIGTGIYVDEESNFNPDKLRYHKIISMCDADVDGHHIETLLLTFFFRYMRPLIERGHIYVAVPPLYKIKYKSTQKYIYEEENLSIELKNIMEKYKIDDKSKIKVQRFKGLGEMNPEELWETTMDPKTRRLKRISFEDYLSSNELFNTLMGDEVQPRKLFIIDHYKDVQNLDI